MLGSCFLRPSPFLSELSVVDLAPPFCHDAWAELPQTEAHAPIWEVEARLPLRVQPVYPSRCQHADAGCRVRHRFCVLTVRGGPSGVAILETGLT
eukprot:3074876-Prymnesium_polylepis.2